MLSATALLCCVSCIKELAVELRSLPLPMRTTHLAKQVRLFRPAFVPRTWPQGNHTTYTHTHRSQISV